MKNTTNAKELGRLLSEKTGLAFEAKNYHDLAKFVEEIVPAISKKDIFGNSPYDCPTYSFENIDIYFDALNHLPYWIITADKKTLTAIWNLFAFQNVFQDTTFYYNDDADSKRVCSTGTVFKGGVERHPAGAKIHKERPTAS